MIRKRKIGETQEPIMTQGIGFSNSVSSVMSIKELKDINNERWNLTNKKSETFNRKEGTLEKISFFYNLFLIILAIVLCIFIKQISKKFVKERLNYEEIRQMHFEFLKAIFFSINAVALEGDLEMAQSMNEDYNSKYPGINLELSDFYYYHFSILAEEIFESYRKLKNLYSKYGKSDYFYAKTYSKEFDVFLENSEHKTKNYITFFEVPLNNFYLISRESYYYININCIFGDFIYMVFQ